MKMEGKYRFYCPVCKRFIDRRQVEADEWNDIFFCRECGEIVIQTKKVMLAMVEDYIDYAIKKNKTDDLV